MWLKSGRKKTRENINQATLNSNYLNGFQWGTYYSKRAKNGGTKKKIINSYIVADDYVSSIKKLLHSLCGAFKSVVINLI